ncbi:MAG: hypothetical protein MJY89_07830 [Bacteroidales bacterium]|nr:hypothetical protein [Bacteroidales bacterium]
MTARVTEKCQLFQWDTNQTLTITGGARYVDFQYPSEIVRIEVFDGVCQIPDVWLQTPGIKSLWICMADNTRIAMCLSIEARPIPPDYASTPEQRVTFDNLVEKVDDLVDDIQERAAAGEFDGPPGPPGEPYVHSEEFSALAQQVRNDAESASIDAESASNDAESASNYAESASNSEEIATQAMTDLLAMMGTDIATLVGGKIPVEQIPSIATTEIYTVETEAQRDALTVQNGDICIVTYNDASKSKSFVYNNGWVYLASPTDYASRAGHADTAGTAESANKINGHRLVEMEYSEFITAVKDANTYYIVWGE